MIAAALLVLLPACSSTTKAMESSQAQPSPAPALDLKAELLSNEIPEGSITLVTIHLPQGVSGPTGGAAVIGEFDAGAEQIPFYPAPDRGEGAYEGILAVPVNHAYGPSQVKVKVGTSELSLPLTVVDAHYPSSALKGVDPRKVNPRKSDMKRIVKEQKEVGEIYARVTPEKFWKGPFKLPIQSQINSPFGSKRTYNGEMRNFHPGLDLRAPEGTPIHAPAPGVVVMAKNLFFTGNTVMIDHGYGVITLYAHMSKLKVKKGQKVEEGHLLGLSGKTGRVTGPHLHWQAVIHKVKINPLDLTKVMR